METGPTSSEVDDELGLRNTTVGNEDNTMNTSRASSLYCETCELERVPTNVSYNIQIGIIVHR